MARTKSQPQAAEQSEIWPESATVSTIKTDISCTIEELESLIARWKDIRDSLDKYPDNASFIVTYTGIKQVPSILSLTVRF